MIFNKNKSRLNDDGNRTNEDYYSSKSGKYMSIIVKIVCVFAAVVLWFYAVGVDTTTYESKIDSNIIKINGVENGLYIFSGDGELADVVVRGTRSGVKNVKSDDIDVFVDASGIVDSGEHMLPVQVKHKDGLSVVSVEPSQITIYISKSTSKQFPLTVNIGDSQIPADCTMQASVVGSDKVTVRGPEDELEKISSASVNVSPGKLSSSVTVKSDKIILTDTSGLEYTNPYVRIVQQEVEVKIELYTTKTVELAVDFRNGWLNNENCTVTVEPSSITVYGTVEDVGQLSAKNIMTIDESEITDSTGKLNRSVTYELPRGVENMSGENKATITLALKNMKMKTIPVIIDNTVITNAPAGKTVFVNTAYLNVRLWGTPSVGFQQMNSASIHVTADMSTLADVDGTQSIAAVVTFDKISDSDVVFLAGDDYVISVTVS